MEFQEISPLDPLPYPFPGSLELFEKFQAWFIPKGITVSFEKPLKTLARPVGRVSGGETDEPSKSLEDPALWWNCLAFPWWSPRSL